MAELRTREQIKYEAIKKLVDEKGDKKEAAMELGCSYRSINRLINLYKEKGKDGFVHGNRNRKPASTKGEETKAFVLDLYRTKYAGENIVHFSELLKRNEGITVSDTTLRKWLFEINIISPRATGHTKERLKKKLKDENKKS